MLKHVPKKYSKLLLAVLISSTSALVLAQAQYPCPTVKIISPYPPGGTTDILSRMIAPGMAQGLGVNVIVENKAGASSNIGTEYVSSSAPDGCTILLGNNTGIVINRNLYKLRIDPTKGLKPVGAVASVPLVLYVNASVPANDINQLVDLIQKNPGKYSYASGGSGSPQHLLGELLKLEKKLDMIHVPYKGQGPALADVLAGQVPIAFETTTAIAPHLSSGRIKVLATTSSSRIKTMADKPTMKEAGYPNFVIENWYGLFVTAKTPPNLVERLNLELNKVLKSTEVVGRLDKMGSTDVSSTVSSYGKFIEKEMPYWESLVKRSGAQVD